MAFNDLLGIVEKAEGSNQKYLKTNYKAIENTQGWKNVLSEKADAPGIEKLRQDNHIRPDYDAEQLQKMSVAAGRDLTAIYDTSGYLSKLLLTAYELDDLFHETMREIFQIDPSSGRSKDGKVTYGAGPVKAEERVRAKAQSDYADRPSPSTSCVIDFIR